MTTNIVQIQALMPDVGCGGGFPRHFADRAARPAGVIADNFFHFFHFFHFFSVLTNAKRTFSPYIVYGNNKQP